MGERQSKNRVCHVSECQTRQVITTRTHMSLKGIQILCEWGGQQHVNGCFVYTPPFIEQGETIHVQHDHIEYLELNPSFFELRHQPLQWGQQGLMGCHNLDPCNQEH